MTAVGSKCTFSQIFTVCSIACKTRLAATRVWSYIITASRIWMAVVTSNRALIQVITVCPITRKSRATTTNEWSPCILTACIRVAITSVFFALIYIFAVCKITRNKSVSIIARTFIASHSVITLLMTKVGLVWCTLVHIYKLKRRKETINKTIVLF